jgi:hypothetical protein
MRVVLGYAMGALLALLLPTSAGAAGDGFVDRDAPIQSGRIFDLGVADYDLDGRQELFSTNHKFLGTFIESAGDGMGWTDLMGDSGFSQNPAYPGFENLLREPEADSPGLYIYARASGRSGADPEKNPTLHIVAKDVTGIPLLPERAEGTLRLRSESVEITRSDGATVDVSRRNARTQIDFSVAERAHLAIKVFKADLPPFQFRIDQAPLLARTYIGPNEVPADSPSFDLRLVDRHGVAWTDANRDGLVDAFIVRGGLGGGIVDFVGEIFDELLIQGGDRRFTNRYTGSGLVKGACRSRLTASVDYDADGLLDLFSSCKAATPKLYRALPSGKFGSRSKALAKVPSAGTYYRWIDLRGDRRPELVVAGKERVTVLQSRGLRRWGVIQNLKARNGTKLVYSVAPGDFDRDGDPDLFVGANSGNTLLVNRGGRLDAQSPARVGLPRAGSGANWVDFDNDGRLDLHSLPRGLYRQVSPKRFVKTGFAGTRLDAVWGLANWLDADNDGYRDVALAIRRPGGEADLDTRFAVNAREGNHWLEVDLSGAPGNPQGVGARVRVTTGGRTQTGWVGQSDGARFSQGHFRLYFGLGDAARADRVTVLWPDGRSTVRRGVVADQRLVISP